MGKNFFFLPTILLRTRTGCSTTMFGGGWWGCIQPDRNSYSGFLYLTFTAVGVKTRRNLLIFHHWFVTVLEKHNWCFPVNRGIRSGQLKSEKRDIYFGGLDANPRFNIFDFLISTIFCHWGINDIHSTNDLFSKDMISFFFSFLFSPSQSQLCVSKSTGSRWNNKTFHTTFPVIR